MFAYQGFEVVGVPAGEVKNPRTSIPFAVFWSLILSAVVYALVQLVFVGVGGGGTSAPLAGAARSFLGARGADLLALGGLISIFGFNCGAALCTPRYLSSLAEDKVLPERLARPHPRFETPALSIVVSTGLVLLLTQILDFKSLVDIAVLAVLGQYVATCAALVRLGTSTAQRVLGGIGVAVSIVFGVQATLTQLLATLALLGVGVAVAGVTRLWSRRTLA
jgi:amino acid transporter